MSPEISSICFLSLEKDYSQNHSHSTYQTKRRPIRVSFFRLVILVGSFVVVVRSWPISLYYRGIYGKEVSV